MPGHDLRVERAVNGSFDVRYEEHLPEGHEVRVVPGEDHTHVVFGTPEDLDALLPTPKPQKAKAPRKSTAKKSTAKKA